MSNNKFPVRSDEEMRLSIVKEYELLDTEEDAELNELTSLTANLFDMPISLITIIDEKRQWFKSHFGLNVSETAREISFCQYTIMGNDVFEVKDALQDERFRENPLVTGDMDLKYYCGAPLINDHGFHLGTLCVIDTKPRELNDKQKKALELMARQVVSYFELHRRKKELEKEKSHLEDIIYDRTKQLQQRLEQLNLRDRKLQSLNNELNIFIYKASHDLRGPLKTMLGITRLALDEAKEGNIQSYLKLLEQTESKLDHTLGNLLKVVEVKEVRVQSDSINLESLIENVVSAINKKYTGRNLNIESEIESGIQLLSDESLLTLMLEELVCNGLDFNVSYIPHVRIIIRMENAVVLISVEDNGIGILETEKERLFDMFYKSNKSRGSGLGLFIVKNVIEKLGGAVEVTSTENKGSVFTLYLPRS